jgi:nitric oxide reductase large subunit
VLGAALSRRLVRSGRERRAERGSHLGKASRDVAGGQQPVVANFYEAGGQHVFDKALENGDGTERHSSQEPETAPKPPAHDPLLSAPSTPSQRATVKYFWIVSALILVQILLGVVTAYYGVEGSGFYGIPLDQVLPYSLARTWHTQLGVLWNATAWLAAGLYIGPAISGHEPKSQSLGVNVLFGALLAIVVGSIVGQWLGVMHRLGHGDAWFYFGHSGYEYIDLGRGFQIALLVGLFFWLWLVVRAISPAALRPDAGQRQYSSRVSARTRCRPLQRHRAAIQRPG